ncbi:MAG TPA: hypothetical protein VF199_04585 [Bacillales bacterium]
MLIGVSFILALAVGCLAWEGIGLLKPITVQAVHEKDVEVIQFPYPFGITPAKVTYIQRYLFYVGILGAMLLFLLAGKTPALFCLAAFFLMGLLLKQGIDLWVRKFKEDLKKELPIFLDTFLSLYQSGVKMEQAIGDSLTITQKLASVFRPVLFRWHNRDGPEAALGVLRSLDVSEIKTCATMFTQVIRGGERSVDFLKEWKEQLTEMEHLNREAGSATKPIFFTALLFLPFGASIVTWFYPFFIQAMHMFDGFLGM